MIVMNIYTDGSCIKNPGGPGGWAFCIPDKFIVSGYDDSTTNNKMELKAVIEALKFANKLDITIHTDSKYVIKCANGEFKINANKDLWDEYFKISKNIKISWVWVKGHSNNYYNNIADKYAYAESTKKFEK